MALTYPVAASYATESFTPSGDLAGTSDIITQTAVIASGVGTVVYLQALGRVTTGGKLKKHNPGASTGEEVAMALAAYAVDATSGDVTCQVITAGEFSMDAITWHADTDTEAEKLAAFGPTSAIKVKKLAYGAA